ncbi:MAG: hypothetical protein IJS17_03545 [Clostridia bacterium]|nr:hypothetical protein [Clostridia bacterium]
MKPDETNEYNAMSAEDKKKQMLEKELAMLDSFYERKAITKENYEKGVAALKKELEAIGR